MRSLLSGTYFPFGSQYYRAPSPPPEDWERDLRAMTDLGFNTVKYWVQWRWNHPERDRFDFADIDRLMDLADGIGLRVMLNTIVDVAPAWIYRDYPDASMVTLGGERVGPQTQPHRQIGGLGICLNHDEVVGHMARFLEATFARYSGHPALETWNVGSEPELTQSMSELRLYANDASRMRDMLCHCDRCRARFRVWLRERYVDIGTLNRRWNRNYGSFDDVEVPRTRNTFNDLVDWRMFFVDTLGRNVRRRFEIARAVDAGRHPLMCHHVFIQGFPVTSTANDPWNVGSLGDLHGFTQMDDPMMHDILRSCARGKPVMSAEMLMLMGYTLDPHREIGADDIKRHVFTGIAANLKGFIFWQYRPELLGREAPAWGLTHTDGSSTPWLEAFAETGRALQRHADFLLDAQPEKAQVAVLYAPENQVFQWAATGAESTATDSLLGVHRALYEANVTVDFLHPDDIRAGHLAGYRALVAPVPYWLHRDTCDAIAAWVADGGTLVAEACLAGWDVEGGRHHATVPGCGLHAVMGVRQRNALPADGTGAVTVRDLPGLPAGSAIRGAVVKETFFTENAEVLARYPDGEAAVTLARHGRGTAIQLGSCYGLVQHREGHGGNGALFAGLVRSEAGIDPVRVDGGRVRVDVLRGMPDGGMAIVRNLEKEPVRASITLGDRLPGAYEELFDGETLDVAPGGVLSVSLGASEVRVYRVR
jgi:beta-galactosidase